MLYNNLYYFGVFVILCICLNACGVNTYLRNYTMLDRPRYAAWNQVKTPVQFDDSVKVVSYNIKYARKIPEAIELLRNSRDLYDADIILLQEMDWDGVDQIAQSLDYNYVYYPAVNHPLTGKDFGNAVLSKWPIVGDQKVILPDLNIKRRQRIAVGAMIEVHDKKLLAFSLHMGVFAKPTQRGKRLDGVIASIPDDIDHVIVGGDFNSFTDEDFKHISEPFQKAEFDYMTADVGWTYRHFYVMGREVTVDHIFAKDMNVVKSGKVINQEPSDHIPIWVEMVFDRQPHDTRITLKDSIQPDS